MTDQRLRMLQARLKLSTNRADILANQTLIAEELAYLDTQRKLVEALQHTNQELCRHPNGRTSGDPRYPGIDCPDCGSSA